MAESRTDRWCAAAAALVPAACLAIAAPFGSQPVNDDWEMYWSAFRFARTGEIRIPEYSAMGMAGWAVPGGALAAVAGESFVPVRLPSMAALLVTGWAVYRLAREFGARPSAALFASVAVSTSPIVFWLGTTFMTDAPWHALWAVSILFLARGLRTGRTRDFVLGAIAGAWAAWIRIPVAAVPLALVVAVVVTRCERGTRVRAIVAAAGVLVVGVAAFSAWYSLVHGSTAAYRYKAGFDVAQAARVVPGGMFACVAYAGLFLAPIAPWALGRGCPARRGAAVAAVVAVGVALLHAKTGFLGAMHKSMPYLGNVAFNLGLGPMTLTDVYREGGAPPVVAPAAVQVALGVACAALGAALAWGILRRILEAAITRTDARTLFVGATVVAYLGAAVLFTKDSAPLFDRYLMPMAAPLAALLVARRDGDAETAPLAKALGLGALVALAAFAVAGTRDYHRFTEARFELAEKALAAAGSPRRVDGGFEFNCWHNYEDSQRGAFTPAPGWKGWLVEDPQFVVSSRERPGYSVIDRRPLFNLVGLKHWDLLLLRRD